MHQGAGAASGPPLRTTPHDRERTSGPEPTVLPTAPNSEEADGNHNVATKRGGTLNPQPSRAAP